MLEHEAHGTWLLDGIQKCLTVQSGPSLSMLCDNIMVFQVILTLYVHIHSTGISQSS